MYFCIRHIAEHVPMDAGFILAAGLRVARTNRQVDGAANFLVDQDVDRSVGAFYADGSDNFFIVDAAIGYRLAKRKGLVSLGVKNLFDEQFNYQDDSYRESTEEPSRGPYYPDRFILGSVVLNF